ncbi:MAG: Sec-independent protein translocase protein TatB [Campylobacterota bacterium]|nr:Sec-independent protein translocase protein TatB [Campylobacterota bacterium]
MFGMGFIEIFLILIVAVMALGPEKLPSAAVDMVKFFKKFKSGLDDAKSTLDKELNISEMKDEANKFKASINEVKGISDLGLDDLSLLDDDTPVKPKEKTRVEKQQDQAEAFKAEEKVVTKKESTIKKETISFDTEVKA